MCILKAENDIRCNFISLESSSDGTPVCCWWSFWLLLAVYGCVCWHYQDSHFCHSGLVVLDEVNMRTKSIDSGLLALWRLIHNVGQPHSCAHEEGQTFVHTRTEAHTLCWHLTFTGSRMETNWPEAAVNQGASTLPPPSCFLPSLASPLSPSQYSLNSQCLVHMRNAWGDEAERKEGKDWVKSSCVYWQNKWKSHIQTKWRVSINAIENQVREGKADGTISERKGPGDDRVEEKQICLSANTKHTHTHKHTHICSR